MAKKLNPFLSFIGIELIPVTYKEKLVSLLGGFFSLSILTLIAQNVLGGESAHFVIGSMGASAVLLFAVPHGQFSQGTAFQQLSE